MRTYIHVIIIILRYYIIAIIKRTTVQRRNDRPTTPGVRANKYRASNWRSEFVWTTVDGQIKKSWGLLKCRSSDGRWKNCRWFQIKSSDFIDKCSGYNIFRTSEPRSCNFSEAAYFWEEMVWPLTCSWTKGISRVITIECIVMKRNHKSVNCEKRDRKESSVSVTVWYIECQVTWKPCWLERDDPDPCVVWRYLSYHPLGFNAEF